MNPFMWIVWGVVALLFLLVSLVVLAALLALVTPGAAVVVALFEDVRARWRWRLIRRAAHRRALADDSEFVARGATFWAVPDRGGEPELLPPAWAPVRNDDMAVVDATTDHGRAL